MPKQQRFDVHIVNSIDLFDWIYYSDGWRGSENEQWIINVFFVFTLSHIHYNFFSNSIIAGYGITGYNYIQYDKMISFWTNTAEMPMQRIMGLWFC